MGVLVNVIELMGSAGTIAVTERATGVKTSGQPISMNVGKTTKLKYTISLVRNSATEGLFLKAEAGLVELERKYEAAVLQMVGSHARNWSSELNGYTVKEKKVVRPTGKLGVLGPFSGEALKFQHYHADLDKWRSDVVNRMVADGKVERCTTSDKVVVLYLKRMPQAATDEGQQRGASPLR